MGRLTQGHFDDVFLHKIKQVCILVLDQLNQANEIEQAFDLCPSVSRRNRVILNFLRDADQATAGTSASSFNAAPSSSITPPLPSLRPPGSIRPSREPSLGTDSVASLSAQRRRRARQMQYVSDPNDSNDDSESQVTIGPSSSRPTHLDPSSARDPSVSQPDYTFEQFVDHLDPTDKLLKRSFEIIIKETARHALAKKRDINYDPSTASTDPAASLRSAIASSRSNRPAAFHPYRSDHLTRSRLDNTRNEIQDRTNHLASSNLPGSNLRRTLRDFLLTSTEGLLGSTHDLLASVQQPHFSRRTDRTSGTTPLIPSITNRTLQTQDVGSSNISPDSFVPELVQRRSATQSTSDTSSTTPQTIASRLAEASRRNAEAARTIEETERLRSSQFIRTSIESLRASLFQLHVDLACTQLQHVQRDATASQRTNSNSSTPDIGSSYALVMDTIELFDDTLRRLSCLVSNSDRDTELGRQSAISQQNTDSSQMRTSLWRARNLLLLSSITRRAHQSGAISSNSESADASSREVELRAHRHLLATIEESRWSRADAGIPSSESIRAWRRKLAAWYHLDRDRSQYPDVPHPAGDREEAYVRWHPDLELPYALNDEVMAPRTNNAPLARPDPIADPRAAWAHARRHDVALAYDLNQDVDVRAALQSDSVTAALQRFVSLGGEREAPTAPATIGQDVQEVAATGSIGIARAEAADPDVSLTRETSLGRRNAVRGPPLTSSDASSIRSARSSTYLRRPRESFNRSTGTAPFVGAEDDNDAGEEDVVETSIEIGTMPHSPVALRQRPTDASESSTLQPPADRPRAGRSESFTFVATPAAVLRSTRQGRTETESTSLDALDEDEEDNSESEAFLDLDLDLDLGIAGSDAFDFDLVDFLRSESRRAASELLDESSPSLPRLHRNRDGGESREASGSASPTGIRMFVSNSGASTPAEARQATFEAYARRARMLRRRRRQEDERQRELAEEA
ncbi:uncharacterized protein MEPE_05276 [Melanopsichium pennsylvanicum]|uniref:Uncharacterized protein n=2 Tax=Melanopsichium pennsylvanicum TaxID=63383 RepID=A0AAJ5C756_9BASI|nr:hypothetical protein BN887_01610 [Melanopsichium pennsylvanicum 4]SNX86567.1 uncharacterized protein MEPE_05276 [Melanopsichium pennsylvanicum]